MSIINPLFITQITSKTLTCGADKTAILWLAPEVFLKEKVSTFRLEELPEYGLWVLPEDAD